MNIVKRMKAPTPKFFRVIRTVGLSFLAVSGALLAEPVDLPAAVLTVANYMGVAGGVATAVSQAAVKKEEHGETADDDERS
jgi:hypothetical protein